MEYKTLDICARLSWKRAPDGTPDSDSQDAISEIVWLRNKVESLENELKTRDFRERVFRQLVAVYSTKES